MSAPQEPSTWPPGCQLWPVDAECLPAGWTENPALWSADQLRAVMLASDWLHHATGKAYGMCLEYLRPCRRKCSEQRTELPGGVPFQPVLWDGRVLNISCGCSGDCGCGPLCEISLPGEVHSIAAVKVDGVVVDPATYRVDNHRRLVRLGGECWPDCQDLSLPETAAGTFAVWYWQGREIPPVGRFALTQLAIEFAKYCAGDDGCKLSQKVTEVVRQGITYTIENARGATSIALVDDWVALVNPYGNTEPGISVWTPDLEYGRTQTWPAAPAGPLMVSTPPAFTYRHTQAVAASTWTIQHNMGWLPNSIVAQNGSGGTLAPTMITNLNAGTVVLTFATPVSGVAYLS